MALHCYIVVVCVLLAFTQYDRQEMYTTFNQAKLYINNFYTFVASLNCVNYAGMIKA